MLEHMASINTTEGLVGKLGSIRDIAHEVNTLPGLDIQDLPAFFRLAPSDMQIVFHVEPDL